MDSQTFVISLLSGACAGTSTDIVFFPIDTLKTRLQAKGGFWKNGGWSGVYRGLGSAVIASAPSASLFFITYDSSKIYVKQFLRPYIKNDTTLYNLNHMISASFGEIMACFVRVPAEIIKQRAQTAQFNSSLSAFRSILANESGEGVVRGLYRGWSTTVMREIPFTIIQFPLYEMMKDKWAQYQKVDRVHPIQGALCGSIAGAIAAASTTPLDVLKTRIMLHREKISVFKLAADMVKEEGYSVFFKGIGPRTMWISFGGAIFLGVYEGVNSMLVRKNRERIE